MPITRRDLLLGATGLAAGAGLIGAAPALAQATMPSFKPEEGASLRVLR